MRWADADAGNILADTAAELILTIVFAALAVTRLPRFAAALIGTYVRASLWSGRNPLASIGAGLLCAKARG